MIEESKHLYPKNPAIAPECDNCTGQVCVNVKKGVKDQVFTSAGFEKTTFDHCEKGGGKPDKNVFKIVMQQSYKLKDVVGVCAIIITLAFTVVMYQEYRAIKIFMAHTQASEERDQRAEVILNNINDALFYQE